jgi:hypothetical protein
MSPVLECRHLCKTWDSHAANAAVLQDVSASLWAREACAVLLNGAHPSQIVAARHARDLLAERLRYYRSEHSRTVRLHQRSAATEAQPTGMSASSTQLGP